MRLPIITQAPTDRADKSVRSVFDSEGWYQHVHLGKGRDLAGPTTTFGTENNRRNIVLSLFMDGFQPHKKVQRSLTLFECMVLNLPENLRHKANLLPLVGLIPGPKKPKDIQPYLHVLVDELLHLHEHGFDIREQDGTIVRVRVKLLFTCADYPAHCELNCQQGQQAHNGCIKCHIKVRTNAQPQRFTFVAFVIFVTFVLICEICYVCVCVCFRSGSNDVWSCVLRQLQ